MCTIPLVSATRDVKTRPPLQLQLSEHEMWWWWWDLNYDFSAGNLLLLFFFAAYQILRYSSIFFSWSKNSCDIFHWLRQNVERFFPELRRCLSKPLTISYFLLLVEKVHVIFLLVEKVHVRSRDLPKTRLRISLFSREFKILSPRIHLCFFS